MKIGISDKPEVTYIVIKPEGIPDTTYKVFTSLCGMAHVTFAYSGDVFLSPHEVLSMYGNLPDSVKEATIDHLANKQLTVIRVYGEDIIAKMTQLRGSKVDPSECEPGTWRFESWVGHPVIPHKLDANLRYFSNFVHTPRNEDEVAVCENLFGKYFH